MPEHPVDALCAREQGREQDLDEQRGQVYLIVLALQIEQSGCVVWFSSELELVVDVGGDMTSAINKRHTMRVVKNKRTKEAIYLNHLQTYPTTPAH